MALLFCVPLLAATPAELAVAAEPNPAAPVGIAALESELEDYVAAGMKAFDAPGLAIGIVAGDRLVYSRGFGVRRNGGAPVDPRTVFQIGSATKAFLATTQAIMVDRGKLHWDDHVIDRAPEFRLMDPWVTREFRIYDLLAQRSGLPPYANDALGLAGLSEAELIRSLRHVEPVASFRATFSYTNITHLVAGAIVARAAEAGEWNEVLRRELLDPLGMAASSYSAAAIEAAADHAEGHRWTPSGTIAVPFTEIFPYGFGGAGNINSTVEDMVRWLRLQLGHGSFAGREIVSRDNLAATRTPKVAISERLSYALGWIIQQTPGGTIVWHNGGTSGFGAFVGFAPDKDIGIVILSNEVNVGFPDALGQWMFDRLLGNPRVDHVAAALKRATANFAKSAEKFARPAAPLPVPPLAPLAGRFANPSWGTAQVTVAGDALVMEVEASGARLKLEPWDGDVFTATLMPLGRFAAVAENLAPQPAAFVQFQIDKDGRANVLRLSMDDGQGYSFTRE